jgi:hypothetical protein
LLSSIALFIAAVTSSTAHVLSLLVDCAQAKRGEISKADSAQKTSSNINLGLSDITGFPNSS